MPKQLVPYPPPPIELVPLLLFLPAARVCAKYVPYPWVAFLSALLLYVLYWSIGIERKPFNSRYWSQGVVILTLILITAAIYVGYPIADGLKTEMKGSDQDDCVILGAKDLLNLQHPFDNVSYFGNPCSPGIGLLWIYVPFVYIGLYEYFSVCVFLLLQLSFFRANEESSMLYFLPLFGLNPLILELFAVGSDFLAIGLLMLLGLWWIKRAMDQDRKWSFVLSVVLISLVATARLSLLILLPLVGIYLWFQYPKKWCGRFGITAAAILFLLFSPLFFVQTELVFLHLVSKGQHILSPVGMGLVVSLTGFHLVQVIRQAQRYSLFEFVLLPLYPLYVISAVADLVRVEGNVALWEGANYVVPIFPLVVYVYIRRRFG